VTFSNADPDFVFDREGEKLMNKADEEKIRRTIREEFDSLVLQVISAITQAYDKCNRKDKAT
jgi:hypothetical protein